MNFTLKTLVVIEFFKSVQKKTKKLQKSLVKKKCLGYISNCGWKRQPDFNTNHYKRLNGLNYCDKL